MQKRCSPASPTSSAARRMEVAQNLAAIRSVINLSEALGIAVIKRHPRRSPEDLRD